MEIGDYARVLSVRWRTIVAGMLVGIAVAAILTVLSPRSYLAGTTLIFGVQGGESLTDLYQGSNMAALEVSSYAAVARSSSILEPVIKDVGLGDSPSKLAESITATVPPNTLVLRIECKREDPREAAAIANAVADQLQRRFSQLAPQTTNGTGTVRMTVLDRASIPAGPSSPVPQRNLAIGAFLGLALGLGIALVRESIDTTIRTRQQLSALPTDPPIPVLAHLVDKKTGRGSSQALRDEAALRLALTVSSLEPRSPAGPAIIFITSSVPGEGKSFVAQDLARALQSRDARTLLMDADTTGQGASKLRKGKKRASVKTAKRERARGTDGARADQDVEVLGLDQIPTHKDRVPGAPLGSALADRFQDQYDYVIVDSTPLRVSPDLVDDASEAGSVLFVVGLAKVKREQVAASYELLTSAKLRLLGSVTTSDK